MLHLPALVMTRQINRVLQAVAKLNMAVRGLYGEGTQALGNFFQFSNQVTLGQKEEDIIDNLERVVKQVIEHEKEARSALFGKKRERVDDQIWRALGVLKTARLIASKESTALLSMLRLGMDMGLVANLTPPQLNELFLLTQPAHLQKLSHRPLSQNERDVRRAELIRERLKDIHLN
jgi:protein arginine kinase